VLPLEIKCIINTIDQKLISKSSTNVSVFLDFDGKEFFIQTKMFSTIFQPPKWKKYSLIGFTNLTLGLFQK